MKNRLCIAAAILLQTLCTAPAQQAVRGVTALSDGTLASPISLWDANALAIREAILPAPSYPLTPWVSPTATIAPGTFGMGWDEQGRFTLQTPFGAFQVYQSGSPAVPVLYWPGVIVSDRNESLATETTLPASNIVGPSTINSTIIDNSLGEVTRTWNGLTVGDLPGIPFFDKPAGMGTVPAYVLGDYFPVAVVTDNGDSGNNIEGRFRARAPLLASILLDGTPPASPTAPGTRGEAVQSGDWLYIAIGTNQWVRIELQTWTP